jgi:hypothetical protein
MRAQQIAARCGVKFTRNYAKRNPAWDAEFKEGHPREFFIDYWTEDGKARLYGPTPDFCDSLLFLVTLDLDRIEQSIKVVETFKDLHEAKCYDHELHRFEVLGGSMNEFAFASCGAPKRVTKGIYSVSGTIDHTKMADPRYDTFWNYDRAIYQGERKFGVVLHQGRRYIPFVGVDKIYLMSVKRVKDLTLEDGNNVRSRSADFHSVRTWNDFGAY